MNVSLFNTIKFPVCYFKENIGTSLTPLQKRIGVVVLAIFACLAAVAIYIIGSRFRARQLNHQIQVLSFHSEGEKLKKEKKFEEAFVQYEKALSLDPKNPLVLTNYGFAQLDYGRELKTQGKVEEAHQQFASAEKKFLTSAQLTFKDSKSLIKNYADFIVNHQKENASKFIPAIFYSCCGKQYTNVAYCQALYDQEKYEAAAIECRKFIKSVETTEPINVTESEILKWQKALEADAQDSVALIAYGSILNRQENYAEAAIHLKKAVKIAPDDHKGLANYADCLYHQEKYQKAARCYVNASRLYLASLLKIEGDELHKRADALRS